MSERGKFHPRNQLNDLTGKEWIRFTRSWFVANPPRRKDSEVQHPAKYPEEVPGSFIEFFTKRGQRVLDPFLGVGSTARAAAQLERVAIGTELNPEYFRLAQIHLEGLDNVHVFNDDCGGCGSLLEQHGLSPVDLIVTSPPYWDMLAHSRGNVQSNHKIRKAKGLDTVYSDDPRDLGNIEDYEQFVTRLAGLFENVCRHLKPGGHLVIILQNLRSPEGRMVPLAWDLTREISGFLTFKGEKIWCQDNKKLGIWGYPSEFVSNVHHHYCLIFKKPRPKPPKRKRKK